MFGQSRKSSSKKVGETVGDLALFMDKSAIIGPYVKLLLNVDGKSNNIFVVTIDDKTTWEYLTKLLDKCDLYLIKHKTKTKIDTFQPTTDGSYHIITNDNPNDVTILFKTPKDIMNAKIQIGRSFRFIDKTEVVSKTGNYDGQTYVSIASNEEAKHSLGKSKIKGEGEGESEGKSTLLKKLKDSVWSSGGLKTGKLLAERLVPVYPGNNEKKGTILDIYLHEWEGNLFFNLEPIGVITKALDTGTNIQQGVVAGWEKTKALPTAAAAGVLSTINPSMLKEGTSALSEYDKNELEVAKTNATAGYYKNLTPETFFKHFRLLINNDDMGGLGLGANILGMKFGGKRRTRRNKSRNNKRKNRKTNRRRC